APAQPGKVAVTVKPLWVRPLSRAGRHAGHASPGRPARGWREKATRERLRSPRCAGPECHRAPDTARDHRAGHRYRTVTEPLYQLGSTEPLVGRVSREA